MASKKKRKTSKKKNKIVEVSDVKKIEDTIGLDEGANQVTVTLTVEELKHIRDLMSITVQDGGTISEQLSEDEYGIGLEAESSLWQLVSDMCTGLNVPTGDDAPDYVVSVVTRDTELRILRKELCRYEEES